MTSTYVYRAPILLQLSRHGLVPLAGTAPQQLRDAVRDLYNHEIKVLRSRLLAGGIERRDYASHIVELRKRYWLLSVPLPLWTVGGATDGGV